MVEGISCEEVLSVAEQLPVGTDLLISDADRT